MMRWETVIGLEIHAQLRTKTKLFCDCPTLFRARANSQVCPICLGHPGVLPRVNRRAVELALRAGLGLNAKIHPVSIFARKHYFYPDLPKGYQITQYRQPLCEGGTFDLFRGEKRRAIRIARVHLEEDAGRSHHPRGSDRRTRLDLNRCGVPLVEIVTEPEIRNPEEAHESLRILRRLLQWLDVCDGNMEEGSLRCDANVSLRPEGEERLGVRTEVKNLNSMKFLRMALSYEVDRQRSLLEGGGQVVQESRHWDETAGRTVVMRGKEEAHDYRYFPEPDLPALRLDPGWVEEIRRQLPELPEARIDRLLGDYDLPSSEAEILAVSRQRADYFDAVVSAGADPRLASSWMVNERLLDAKAGTSGKMGPAVAAESFAFLLRAMTNGKLSGRQARAILSRAIESGEDPLEIIEREGTKQVSDASRIGRWVEDLLDGHPEQVSKYFSGRSALFRFFIGEVIKSSNGEANPSVVARLLAEALEERRKR